MRKICFGFLMLILLISAGQSHPLNKVKNFSKSSLVKTEIDTTKLLSDTPIKSPMGAVLRSAILPGWGQFYNEKYLKAIFVLSVNGALAYAIYHYDDQWEKTGNKKGGNRVETDERQGAQENAQSPSCRQSP